MKKSLTTFNFNFTIGFLDYFKLDIKALEQKNHRKLYNRLKKDRQFIELYFVDTPDKLKREYLDMYGGVGQKFCIPQNLMKIQI